MDMSSAKRCGLQALLKQMHALMAEGKGESPMQELVEEVEAETGMGNEGEAEEGGEMSLAELIKTEMKRGGKLPSPKGAMVVSVEAKAKPPMKGPAKAMKYG